MMRVVATVLGLCVSLTVLAENCPTVNEISELTRNTQSNTITWQGRQEDFIGKTPTPISQGKPRSFVQATWTVTEGIVCYYAMDSGSQYLRLVHSKLVPFSPKWLSIEYANNWQITNQQAKLYSEYKYICQANDVKRCPF